MYLTWAGAPGEAGNVNHDIIICMQPAGGSPDHAARPGSSLGSDGTGPLLLGSPAEVGEGCSRHVVVLWPPLSPHPQPCPTLESHTGIAHRTIYLDRCGQLQDRITMALGLCKISSQPPWSPDGWTFAEFRHPIKKEQETVMTSDIT